ncbi:MAG: BamA/TamA family outer membrane protein [Planctomycetales bacterium]|nr:BamA/TamA family outer membrane protein [Planctomycetales bacterium]
MRFTQTIAASWIAGVLCATGCATLTPTKPSASPLSSYAPQSRAMDEPEISVPETGASADGIVVNKPGTSAQGSNTRPSTKLSSERVVRGQSPRNWFAPINEPTAGSSEHMRRPMQISGEPITRGQSPGYGYPSPTNYQPQGGYYDSPVAQMVQNPLPEPPPAFPGVLPPGNGEPLIQPQIPLPPAVDFDVYVEETRTGRFMFGMGVNSDLGVTGQITIDERNFDWRRPPTSFQDVVNGTAWRGGGQGFRLEAQPGTQVQRYLVSFTQPYLYLGSIPTPFSLNLSGFFYNRNYFDWDEERLGGRAALGYRLTHDLSLSAALRAENVGISGIRVPIPELTEVAGDNSLFSGKTTLTHDTRDTPFAATEGHLIELSYEQAFGSFDYPRGEIDYRQYFLARERPDGSGRHTLAYSFRFGFSGPDTPIYENFFAGGFSTMRGFNFRGASPKNTGVVVGGEFQFLGSVEYMFPLTADDMLKGVVFCDYGTTEESIEIDPNNYRVAPGMGLRISIPAMGPAPLALDLAVPIARAPGDQIQNFSFFFGFGR